MKKYLLFTCVLISVFTATAQTEKGNYLLGGSIGLRTNKNNSLYAFMPNVGYFVEDQFAIGGNVNISFAKEGNVKTTNVGIGPFMRYYLGSSTFRPFITGGIGFQHSRVRSGQFVNNQSGMYAQMGLGFAAFISEDVAFEGIAAYNHSKLRNEGSSNGFSLNFGFQVYINKNKMATLKQGRLVE